MKNIDLRVRRTYKLLQDSLIALIKQKPFEKISVTDICQQAMVHRATFYSHFDDKYQLLNYCIQGFFAAFNEVEDNSHSHDEYIDYFTSIALKVLIHMEKNREICIAFLNQNVGTFEKIMAENLYNQLSDKYDRLTENGTVFAIPRDIFASYYSGACSRTILWWVQNDMPISSEKLTSYFRTIIEANICPK